MPYVTLVRNPSCIGRIIGQPWLLPGHYHVEWLWSSGHDWRSPQSYPAETLKRLEGDFQTIKDEIMKRKNTIE